MVILHSCKGTASIAILPWSSASVWVGPPLLPSVGLIPSSVNVTCLSVVVFSPVAPATHIPQFRERKNRIVNTQDQAGEESVDEELAGPGRAFASVSQRGYARDQCPQNTGKPSASWGEWLACSPG